MPNLRTENAAELAAMLAGRLASGRVDHEKAQRPDALVLALQKAARTLHRNAERRCNEDLACPVCRGSGEAETARGRRKECRHCLGTGDALARREGRLVGSLRDLLKPYGLHVYEQGDCRGWPLYLVPVEAVPEPERLGSYLYPSDGDNPDVTAPELRESLRARWIAANYNSHGVAVCPH